MFGFEFLIGVLAFGYCFFLRGRGSFGSLGMSARLYLGFLLLRCCTKSGSHDVSVIMEGKVTPISHIRSKTNI